MAVRMTRPRTNAQRHIHFLQTNATKKSKPVRSLRIIKKKNCGRNNSGQITVRHQGSGEKRYLRLIDFRRDKRDIAAKVAAIEYDPNRTANIALLNYADGEKRYILCPDNLKIGDTIICSQNAEAKPGNAMPLSNIPIGLPIHNIELMVGKGGQLARSAGTAVIVQSKEGGFVNVLLPSGEIRRISENCFATIGQVSNQDWKNVSIGKAGRNRHRGIRPSVRGTAMAPNAHPHGGGEGRTGVGMKAPKSVYGKRVQGVKTRSRKKHSNIYIISRRKK